MDFDDYKGLRFYIVLMIAVVGFYLYSAMIGWKWFNPTSTEREPGEGPTTGRSGHVYRYHK